MHNYWENTLYPQFLLSVDDCTLSEFTNFEIQNQLGYLVIRATEDFKFPKVSLDYSFDENINVDTDVAFGYYFQSNEVKQREFNVILARMKQYWIEFQMSQERMFSNVFYDKDIRLHSPGNTIAQLLKMYAKFRKAADMAEYNYGRVTDDKKPSIGAINE